MTIQNVSKANQIKALAQSVGHSVEYDRTANSRSRYKVFCDGNLVLKANGDDVLAFLTVEVEVKKAAAEAEVSKSVTVAAYKPGKAILQLVNLLREGVTKAQICAALGWKDWNPSRTAVSKLGYSVRFEAGKFWLVEEAIANAA